MIIPEINYKYKIFLAKNVLKIVKHMNIQYNYFNQYLSIDLKQEFQNIKVHKLCGDFDVFI